MRLRSNIIVTRKEVNQTDATNPHGGPAHGGSFRLAV